MKNKYILLIIAVLIIGGAFLVDFGFIVAGICTTILGFCCFVLFPLLSGFINDDF